MYRGMLLSLWLAKGKTSIRIRHDEILLLLTYDDNNDVDDCIVIVKYGCSVVLPLYDNKTVYLLVAKCDFQACFCVFAM